MAVISSILFAIAFALAVILGPQTRPWPWGPALIPLGLALLAALPSIWRGNRLMDKTLLVTGILATIWFAARAWMSPVAEMGVSDSLLLAGAAGSFLVMRAISASEMAIRVFTWAIALLLAASVCVIALQIKDPTFSAVFASRPALFPSGFFSHYNEGANFLIGTSLLLAGAAIFGSHSKITRAVWLLIALGGMIAVYFTGSRGAILALAVGVVVFMIGALLATKRTKSRWFAPLIIGLPLCAILAAGFVYYGWVSAQEMRRDTAGGMANLMDNTIRLSLMGIAVSCIQSHPLLGGGSRSFSWESYQFWTAQDNGWNAARPEMVHNELLQSATDYGLIGFALIVALLFFVAAPAMFRTLFDEKERRHPHADAFYVGGLAGIAGMLVQSSFSFVFHLLPGVMLLGICLGRAALPSIRPAGSRGIDILSKTALIASCVALAGFSLFYGKKGTELMAGLWPAYFGPRSEVTEDQRLDAMAIAIQRWPQSEFYADRAFIRHQKVRAELEAKAPLVSAEEAISDYYSALRLYPFNPSTSVNLARLLSIVGRDAEATKEFERATHLQGGMELVFRARFYASSHLLKVARAQFEAGDTEQALAGTQAALDNFNLANQGHPSLYMSPDGAALRISIYELLGVAQQASGDEDTALKTFDQLAKFGSGRGKYRAGLLLESIGSTDWYERRPSEALTYFQEARTLIAEAADLPANVTAENKAAQLAALDEKIAILIAAKITPAPKEAR